MTRTTYPTICLSVMMDLDYMERLSEFEAKKRKLQAERDLFVKNNPNHPFRDSMYIQVTAPPQRIIFTTL